MLASQVREDEEPMNTTVVDEVGSTQVITSEMDEAAFLRSQIVEIRRRKDGLYAERAEQANREVQIRLLLELVDEMVKNSLPWLHDHTRQICSCAHIYACAKLPSGEEMLLAYFEFTKSLSGFRCFRADFLLYSNCIIVPSRRLKNSVVVPIYRLGA